MHRNLTIFLILLLVISGCGFLEPEPRNLKMKSMPEYYSLYSQENPKTQDTENWWESFKRPDLNQMIETSIEDGFSIREARARLNQAKAAAKIVSSDRYPGINAQGGPTFSRSGSDTTGTNSSEKYELGLMASYEVDLWGKNRFLAQSGQLDARASHADLETAVITLSATMAESWVDHVFAIEELKLLEKQVSLNETLLRIQELRFEKSRASALEVLQQQETLERIKAQIPDVQARISVSRNSLLFLMGKSPGEPLPEMPDSLPKLPPLPQAGVPTDLLSRRPDIVAAGLRLVSSDFQVAAARANRLPSLKLTGNSSLSSAALDTLFQDWILSLAANISGTIYDAGSKKAEVDRRKAVTDEKLAVYEKVVMTAVREVEDALTRENFRKKQLTAQEKQLETAKLAYMEAERRYAGGLITYLPVVVELNTLQNLEREILSSRAVLYKTRISLHRSLGNTGSLELKDISKI